jgi:hypothetical protein
VVARRPSSSPVAAKMNAPTQIEAIRVPRAEAQRSATSTSSGIGAIGSARPGRRMVSALISISKRQGTCRVNVPASISSVGAQMITRYAACPSGKRVRPKSSIGVDRSNASTPSRARIATVCMALLYHPAITHCNHCSSCLCHWSALYLLICPLHYLARIR